MDSPIPKGVYLSRDLSHAASFSSCSHLVSMRFCSCDGPARLVWMDSESTSSELLSETGSIADSDLRDVDLELAAVTAPTQVVEVFSSPGISRGARH